MNRFLRTCLINRKNFLKLAVNKSNPITTTVFRKISIPINNTISIAASTLFNINRSFNDNARRGQNFEEDLVEEADASEVSASPKSHKSDSSKNYGEGQPKFEDFNLAKELLDRLTELGYETPFPIQSATLPFTLAGKDVIGRAITGSGKTLAFSIPIIMKVLSQTEKSTDAKCLVLSPTRELCQQIQRSIQELTPQLRCVAVYGGGSVSAQMAQLNSGCDIICATPGRLRDLLDRSAFKKEHLELICLDEADQLLTPNFLTQIEFVLQSDKKRQMLMFSATINKIVSQVVSKYMDNPEFIDLTDGDQSKRLPENVKHFYAKSPQHVHSSAAEHLIKHFKSERCVIFTNRKSEKKFLPHSFFL